MPRNKTATQKRARDFYNQTKYGCFISHGIENTQKIISSRSKSRNKNLRHVFYFIYQYHSGKIRKKINLAKLELSKRFF